MSRPFAVVVALVTAFAVVLAACGVPDEDDPRELSADNVPFDLLAPASTVTSTTVPEGASRQMDVFFVRRDRLVPASREVAVPVDPKEVIAALLKQPTEAESDRGLRTAIPPGTEVLGAEIDGEVLVIDLSDDISTLIQGPQQQQAFAQLVFTGAQFNRVERVRFEVEGERTPVPVGDGSLQEGPVRPAQYRELDPDRPQD